MLFNQFHDLDAGSGIGIIYKEAQKDYDVVRWSTNEISAGALGTVDEKIDTQVKHPEAVPVVVFNPLGWKRPGVVTVKLQLPGASPAGIHVEESTSGKFEGSELVSFDKQTGVAEARIFVRDIPAMGYKSYQVFPEPPGSPVFPATQTQETADSLIIENANLRVTVDKKTGCITGLFDKRANFESLSLIHI